MTKVLASKTAEGHIVILRSDPSKPKECVCCGGPHIFGRAVHMDRMTDGWGTLVTRSDTFIDDFACQKGEDKEPIYEGKRVRVTVEILDEDHVPLVSTDLEPDSTRLDLMKAWVERSHTLEAGSDEMQVCAIQAISLAMAKVPQIGREELDAFKAYFNDFRARGSKIDQGDHPAAYYSVMLMLYYIRFAKEFRPGDHRVSNVWALYRRAFRFLTDADKQVANYVWPVQEAQ